MKDELDDYLAARSALSQAYAQAPRPEPPAALDRAVLDEVRGRAPLRSPMLAPLGLAATVLLSIAVLSALVLKPAVPAREHAPPRLVPARYESASGAQRAPAAWLEAIAQLKRDGRIEEAAQEMRRFRQSYPRYPVPSED